MSREEVQTCEAREEYEVSETEARLAIPKLRREYRRPVGFDVATAAEAGASTVVLVANGVASAPASITVGIKI